MPWYYLAMAGKTHRPRGIQYEFRNCAWCGETFQCVNIQQERTRRFCGSQCSGLYHRRPKKVLLTKARACRGCKRELPWADFHSQANGFNGKNSRCKTCVNSSVRAATYGITKEEILRLELAADGLCQICKRPGRLCIDHDHSTRMVRGVLCKKCNSAIGLLGDDPKIIRAALDYLEGTQ